MIFFNRNFIFMLFLNRNIIVIIFFNRKLVVPQLMLGSTKSRTYLLSVHSEQRYGRSRTNDLCSSTLLTLVRFGGAWWLVRVGRACSEIMFAFIYNDNFRINNVREGFRYEICYVYNIYYVPPPKNPGFPSLSPRFVGVIYIYINNFLNISFRRFFLEIKVA